MYKIYSILYTSNLIKREPTILKSFRCDVTVWKYAFTNSIQPPSVSPTGEEVEYETKTPTSCINKVQLLTAEKLFMQRANLYSCHSLMLSKTL